MKISSALVFALLAFATAEARWCKNRRNREAKPFQVEGECSSKGKMYVETSPPDLDVRLCWEKGCKGLANKCTTARRGPCNHVFELKVSPLQGKGKVSYCKVRKCRGADCWLKVKGVCPKRTRRVPRPQCKCYNPWRGRKETSGKEMCERRNFCIVKCDSGCSDQKYTSDDEDRWVGACI